MESSLFITIIEDENSHMHSILDFLSYYLRKSNWLFGSNSFEAPWIEEISMATQKTAYI